MNISITIISSLISGILSVLISTYFFQRYEKRKQRLEVLRDLVGYRFALTHNTTSEAKIKFFSALNQVSVLFHNEPEVIKALHNMHRELQLPDRLFDNLVTLHKSICKVLGIKIAGLNDDFFLTPFNATYGYEK
ncbi:DUF6680 family protein [Endozoicomonas sp.]|uniref:DUF6680 family protein n=1 Tax=Endozoicomonas sp. TaxID=1892382 RepID=UPI003AF8383A